MPHKMMPISMAKHNWAGKARQNGKNEMTSDELRKPENKKKQLQEFVRGRR